MSPLDREPAMQPSVASPLDDRSDPSLAASVRGLAGVLAAIAVAIFLAVLLDHGGRSADRDAWEPPPDPSGRTLSETDPSLFLLNALLVPAFDREALPLRWADPRPPADCGPGTTVDVDGHPLIAGALVPAGPFELSWDARACRPFGPHGPRFEGAVRMTVFHEDWGWSAIVEPADLRIATRERTLQVTRHWVTMPQWADPYETPNPGMTGD